MSKRNNIEERLERLENKVDQLVEMTSQLIQMVGTTNKRINDLEETINNFRDETTLNFIRLTRRTNAIETDLDRVIKDVDDLKQKTAL